MAEIYTIDKFVDGVETLLRKALKDLGAMRGSLMVLDNREKVLRIKVAVSLNPSGSLGQAIIDGTRLKLGEGVSGMVAQTKKPILINDMEELKRQFPGLQTTTDSARYESSLVVPILEDGLTVAVLNINDKVDGGRFTNNDLLTSEMLAEYCGVALKLERLNRGILHVNEIIREISLTNSLNEIYRLVVSNGAEILDCESASLMLVEKRTDGSHYLVVKESTDRDVVGQTRKLGESVSGYVWKTGEPILIKSVEDGIRDRRFKILNKPGSFIVVPLNLKYQTPYALNVALKSVSTIGVLNFTQRAGGHAFTSEQLEAIINYSNLVAIAIEKARYFNESKTAYLSTVKALSAALESKDGYTKAHSDSVEFICGALADRLYFTDKEKEDLQIAALLHDIGKIGIPEAILHKKGRLTSDEYTKIKTHIEEADNILRHTFYLDDSREIVRHHHESFDGTGYPAGLRGEDIPMGARVLAAADALHAMTSNRPYREAMPLEAVAEELSRCSGKQFDPQVVGLLLEILHTLPLSGPEDETSRAKTSRNGN
ncbi:MAG: GAF domain-containing protein [Nitrospirae bacterium]|nr:GAF domain-containing protein [Nitrospirota bacterium]MBI5696842.1 GAF domain-containing protein [Nitrospirota bacterium]